MRFAILGDGPEERGWAEALTRMTGAELALVCPAWGDRPELRSTGDLDSALTAPGIDWFILVGKEEERGEALRRAAAEGVRVIVRHPAGDSVDAYYQVALTPQETGAVIVPDLGLRLHPGLEPFRKALGSGELGAITKLRLEGVVPRERGRLVEHHFARVVDVLVDLGGEVAAVSATGDAIGGEGGGELRLLLVQLRFSSGMRGEVELRLGTGEAGRLSLEGERGEIVLELGLEEARPARLVKKLGAGLGEEQVVEIEAWSPRVGLLREIEASTAARRGIEPGLSEGTRASEITEAVQRSLRRNRTIELHGATATELGNFKAVMAASGCGLVLILLLLLPLALMGPALGVRWTVYLAWLIPPLLVLFIVAQFLRIGIKERPGSGSDSGLEKDQAAG